MLKAIFEFMKPFLTILLLFVITSVCNAQFIDSKEASAKYYSGNYVEAIKLYRDILDKNGAYADADYKLMLGMSYMKADSIVQAKQVFDQIIIKSRYGFRLIDTKIHACKLLADLYLEEKNYLKAIHYYQLYAVIIDKSMLPDVNHFRIKFFNATTIGHCFEKLGFIDSAINSMTPYMFCMHRELPPFYPVFSNYKDHKDSLEHDSVSRYYISLLQKKYTNRRIKVMYKKIEKSFKYDEKDIPTNKYGYFEKDIKCTMTLYNKPFVVFNETLYDDKRNCRQEYANYFHRLPIFGLVRDLPKKSKVKG